MQIVTFGILRLLEHIKNGHFLIPQFQRDFTWKMAQTKLLIDSIARNYPIGSLLVLEKNDNITLQSRKLDANYENDSQESERLDKATSSSCYVLDGQQRLTSIARFFLKGDSKKNYYFDLKAMYESFEKENLGWIISRPKRKTEDIRKDDNRLIRADIVMKQEKCDIYIAQYIEEHYVFEGCDSSKKKHNAYVAAAKLKGIFETIRNFSIPVVTLDNSVPLESVCRVFETINSTGTRLTTFDLAVAKYFPDPALKDLFDKSQEELPILKDYDVDGEAILKILSLYHLRDNKKFPEPTRAILLSLPKDFINDKWEEAATCLSDAFKWLRNRGAIPITKPPHGMLVSIAATLMFFPRGLNQPYFSVLLERWYFCSTLTTDSVARTNYKIGSDFGKLCDFLGTGGDFIDCPMVYFSTSAIIAIQDRKNNSNYQVIQALMRNNAKKDLMTGDPLDNNTEDHHIYPYALYKSGLKKNALNSIANKVIVSKSTNRDLRDKNPEKYLVALIEQNKNLGTTAVLDRIKACLIPYNSNNDNAMYKTENFNKFLENRANLIIDKIREVVGKAWREPALDE